MKKLISFLLCTVMIVGMFAGCAKTEEKTSETKEPAKTEQVTVNAAVMTGPTAIGMVKLMEDNRKGVSQNSYNFTVAGSADEITPKLVQGALDIAAVPVNLASVLYNKTNGGVKILAVNTLGVLYIVTKGTDIATVSDLKGKTIYATGKGATPEYTLRHVLEKNDIDPDNDVTIEFKTEPKEIVAVMKNAENAVAMLPQPYVTVAGSAVEGLSVALDLTAEWDKLGENSRLITGALVVRTAFADAHPEIVSAFLKEYEKSANYANEDVDGAAELLGSFGIFDAAVAKKAIPFCNVVCITGSEMKNAVSGYLEILHGMNPASVGKNLPADDFYYVK